MIYKKRIQVIEAEANIHKAKIELGEKRLLAGNRPSLSVHKAQAKLKEAYRILNALKY